MPETGTLLQNRYLIVHIERISSFSKIFFALDTYQDPPRSCLVKIFEPIIQKTEIAQRIDREFQQETKYLKQLSLSNRHIPEIYTYSSELQAYYIVRELIEGEPLNKKVESHGELSCQEVRKIAKDLLSVLIYLHEEGAIHQNIKPKNIILRNGDRMPMLINFGSIKQIVNTYGFYGDKRIFSSSNIHGYAPAEQALGKSVPASDIYSLGFTALYLLTGKHPVDLAIGSDSGEIQVPLQIYDRDPHLAAIIARAINSKISDRYPHAQAMYDDLLSTEVELGERAKLKDRVSPLAEKIDPERVKKRHIAVSNWWLLGISALTCVYILGAALFALYDWNSNRSSVRSLPEPESIIEPILEPESETISEPILEPESETISETPLESTPLMLNSSAEERIEIPIFATGTSKEDLIQVLGKPSAIQKGYWANSSAWIYKKQASDSIDLGYLFDSNTNLLKQTEVAIAPSVGLTTIEDILSSLIEDNLDPQLDLELKKIYNRQTNRYTFKREDLEGSIERDSDDRIYLGVWEADFH